MGTAMKSNIDDLYDWIEGVASERADHHIAFLSGLLRFPTVSGEGERSGRRSEDPAFVAAFRYLRHEAERLGLVFRDHRGESAIIEWLGADADAPTLGIATHLDVVPVADGTWTHPPFGGTVTEGHIWGRGTQDDKGPIGAVLAAFDVLQRLGMRPRRTIRLIIGTYEETEDWPDMDRLFEVEAVPDEVIVPDGGFPVGIGEKGIATLEWAADWRRSDGDDVLRFRSLVAGERANMVPGHGRIMFDARGIDADRGEALLDRVLVRLLAIRPSARPRLVRSRPGDEGAEGDVGEGRVRFVVEFMGRSAHAAIPHEGHNAALDALAFMMLQDGEMGQADRFARFLFDATSVLDGSGVGVAHDHPMMGETTLNLGRIEMDAAGAHALVNVRFPVGLTPRSVEDAFRAHASRNDLGVHTRMMGRPQPPFLVDTDRHAGLLAPLEAAYEKVTGREATRLAIAGTTYAKLFPVAVGFGPVDLVRGEPVRVHQVDERVTIDRFLENIRIYALALALLAFPGHDA